MATTSKPLLRPELLDDPDLPLDQTERALSDLERVNRWLFGLGASVRTLIPRIDQGPTRQRLIDLGTGTGQVSRRLREAARRRGVELEVIGVDRKLSHLLTGRRRTPGRYLVVACASSLPFRSESADWVFSHLLFHHFSQSTNRRILAEMDRVARRASVVVDLRRSRLGRALANLLLPLMGLGSVALYDGRLSVEQAWDLEEIRRLVDATRIDELKHRFPVRFSLVLRSSLARDPGDPTITEPPPR